MNSGIGILLGAIVFMLVIGTVFALVWWGTADLLFPGVAQKTGQRLFKKKRKPVRDDAVVVKGFDQSPGAPGTT